MNLNFHSTWNEIPKSEMTGYTVKGCLQETATLFSRYNGYAPAIYRSLNRSTSAAALVIFQILAVLIGT